jgi:hypothetical protein
MAAIAYTKAQLVERIKKHISDGFTTSDFSTTDNEVLLYIDSALAFGLVGQVYANAKVEGTLVMPEAYLTTYTLAELQQDSISGYWFSTLPQPPVNLPLGYSINRAYFGLESSGQSREIYPIRAKRVGYRINMPMPTGARYWVEGSKFWVASSDGGSLLGLPVYVQMASTRTTNMTDTMNLPDDALEAIFTSVVAKMKDRLQLPKDIIKDDVSAGNKSS